MPIENIESAPRSEITIAGVTLSVPAPFSDGHVLRPNEAGVLNQTYAENIRNNFAAKVKAAQKVSEESGQPIDPASLQIELDTYIQSYDFGVRRGGGTRVVLDPVTKEALRLASERVKAALKKRGLNLKEVGNAKIKELAEQALEQHPILMERAQQIVALKSDLGQESLDLEV